jgi:hypothetical protein
MPSHRDREPIGSGSDEPDQLVSAPMTPPSPDRTRQWILAQRVLVVAFLLAVVTLALVGVEFWIMLLLTIPLVLAGTWACQASRPWWGSGPMALLADPVLRKEWRRSDVRFEVIALLLIVAVPTAVILFSGIAP